MTLQGFARSAWEGRAGVWGRGTVLALRPAAWAYGAAVAARNRRFDRAPAARVDGLPVVSVGNLAVGGTGKTPFAAWVASSLEAHGATPALLTRGYADEVALHRSWSPQRIVLGAPDRYRIAVEAREAGADAAVLDDGFQHRALARDLDLVLLAAEDPFPGPLLPAGPYREPPEGLARADAVIVTRRRAAPEVASALAAKVVGFAPDAVLGQVHLAPGAWATLDGQVAEPPPGDVLAVTSVARAEDFGATVRSVLEGPVDLLAFADHHAYDRADVDRILEAAGARTVVTTEKDAVKLQAHPDALRDVRVLALELRWEAGRDAIDRRLATVVGGPP